MPGSWTSAMPERYQACWLFISTPAQEPRYGHPHRSFHQQQREDSAGSSVQETDASDRMVPPVFEVEWEERPTARGSPADRKVGLISLYIKEWASMPPSKGA